jgi:hypothetical protein
LLAVGLWGSHQTPFRFLSEARYPVPKLAFLEIGLAFGCNLKMTRRVVRILFHILATRI